MMRLLVGIDGSPESEAALGKAADLAKDFKAGLLLVHIAPRHQSASVARDAAELRHADVPEHEYVPALLFHAEQICRKAGVEAESMTQTGPVAEGLSDLAESAKADLVIVGHRGRGTVRRTFLGSVADRLVQICGRPVLVVR